MFLNRLLFAFALLFSFLPSLGSRKLLYPKVDFPHTVGSNIHGAVSWIYVAATLFDRLLPRFHLGLGQGLMGAPLSMTLRPVSSYYSMA